MRQTISQKMKKKKKNPGKFTHQRYYFQFVLDILTEFLFFFLLLSNKHFTYTIRNTEYYNISTPWWFMCHGGRKKKISSFFLIMWNHLIIMNEKQEHCCFDLIYLIESYSVYGLSYDKQSCNSPVPLLFYFGKRILFLLLILRAMILLSTTCKVATHFMSSLQGQLSHFHLLCLLLLQKILIIIVLCLIYQKQACQRRFFFFEAPKVVTHTRTIHN